MPPEPQLPGRGVDRPQPTAVRPHPDAPGPAGGQRRDQQLSRLARLPRPPADAVERPPVEVHAADTVERTDPQAAGFILEQSGDLVIPQRFRVRRVVAEDLEPPLRLIPPVQATADAEGNK